jgi:hypothetical protein
MDEPEATSHSFIVRVWLEETAEEAGRAIWRGSITHVPSGQRKYLQELGELVAFIQVYLQTMGVDDDRRWYRQVRRRSKS